MSVTERQRHALHEWAKPSGGEEVAETLMELLPPVGWADVATKRDLDVLRLELKGDLHRELRLHMYWVVGSIFTALGIALAVLAR